jgi:hypothetical protein
MRLIARIMLLLFAVVTVSGHGAAQPLVYHAQDHHQTDAHGMDGHDHEAGVMIPIAGKSATKVDFCAQNSCEAPESDQSGAHFHIPCCGSFMALLPAELGVKAMAVDAVEQAIGHSSLALGELRYPLLRPPCLLV